ncbi:ABC transporter permease [Gracilibacillus dipsosauri]|uniref:ABC transporter permease n=1 Tax=Gracilibacillus dipsosauri TaxID=178340 RepID=UPI0024098582
MNKFWIVFSHTFMSKIKAKSFIITTALFLAFIIIMSNIQSIMDIFDQEEAVDQVAVVTEIDSFYEALDNSLQTTESEIEIVRYNDALEKAQEQVIDGEYKAVLEITEQEQLPAAVYYTAEMSSTSIESTLNQALEQIKTEIATNKAGLDPRTIATIYEPISFEKEPIVAEGEEGSVKTEEELSGARGLVYVILFLLYFAVIAYGNMIATDIANEKTSRVMEILISSSSPVSQMFAKILGIGSVGLVQMLLYLGVGYIVIQQKQEELVGGFFEFFGLSETSASTFVYAIVFFLLGYFLYATLSAMLGSLVSRTEDVQQLMTPVILLIVVAFMISIFGLSNPSSQFVTIASYIPFFSPMAMFLRVGMLNIPFWEVGLSIAILIITIVILAIVGARVYRGGVLMYGTSTSLKDFKKALQLSKKD